MNKLIIALCSSAFVFGSASVLAQAGADSMLPLSKMQTEQSKAASAEAKAKWAKMTPEEQAAAKKAARAKKQSELTALDNMACENCYDAKKAAAEAAASKAQPVPTKTERQQDLKNVEKKSGPGQ